MRPCVPFTPKPCPMNYIFNEFNVPELVIGTIVGMTFDRLIIDLAKRGHAYRERRKFGLSDSLIVEYIRNAPDRCVSLGTLDFSMRSSRINFNGTNFSNDGNEFENWKTELSNADPKTKRFTYKYIIERHQDPHHSSSGFGEVIFENSIGPLRPAMGYFMDIDHVKNRQHVKVKRTQYHSAEEIAQKLNFSLKLGHRHNLRDFVVRINEEKERLFN